MTDDARPDPVPEGTEPASPKPAGVKPAGPSGSKPVGPPKRPPGSPTQPRGVEAARPGVPQPAGKRPPARTPSRPPGARTVPREAGGDGDLSSLPVLTRKDFVSSADVRWCPGCGDYAVLAAVQRALPELAEHRENVVFISGIGCSSRFPYYMNTYGFHTIHGRAPAVATGLKTARPELDVWLVTGDGDALSIGGNHLAHLLRRNVDLQLLLFNNQIYGLTKGQYSPTSEVGKVTKSSPYGSLDHPFNPASFALGADATFVARTLDRDPKHMQGVLKAAHGHRGSAFVEIYQNCNIFNDGAFFDFTEKATKSERALFVEHGQPLVFAGGTQGLRLDGLRLEAVPVGGAYTLGDLLVHDAHDRALAGLLTQQLFWDPDLPRPFGVLYQTDRPAYDRLVNEQVEAVTERKGAGDLQSLLEAGETWTIA